MSTVNMDIQFNINTKLPPPSDADGSLDSSDSQFSPSFMSTIEASIQQTQQELQLLNEKLQSLYESAKSTDGKDSLPPAQTMNLKDAATTMAAYMHEAKVKNMGKKELEALAQDPKVSQDVRNAATTFLENPTALNDVDGARNGKKDDILTAKDFEAFIKNGATADPGQAAAMDLRGYMDKNNLGIVTKDDLAKVADDPKATAAEKDAAAYFLENSDAFDSADGSLRKGKTDGNISKGDLSTFSKAQIDSDDKAVKTLHDYLTRNDTLWNKVKKPLEIAGMALAAAALAAVPGVGEAADAALFADLAADAAAAAGEAAGEAGASLGSQLAREGLKDLTKQVVKDAAKGAAKDTVKDTREQLTDEALKKLESKVGSPSQDRALTGEKGSHTVNIPGLEQIAADANTPLAVRNAIIHMLENPELLKSLFNEMDDGKSGHFSSHTLGEHDKATNKSIKDAEAKVNVWA
jgi:uncharacterized protein (UPF0147 family)